MEWSGSMCMLRSRTQQPCPSTAMPAALRRSRKRVRMRQGCSGGQEGCCFGNSSADGRTKQRALHTMSAWLEASLSLQGEQKHLLPATYG